MPLSLESEGLLMCSQELTTFPYVEPNEPSSHLYTLVQWFSKWVPRNPGVPRNIDENLNILNAFVIILHYEYYKVIFKNKWIQTTEINWMLRQRSDCNCPPLACIGF
jgi:hypothetical protein